MKNRLSFFFLALLAGIMSAASQPPSASEPAPGQAFGWTNYSLGFATSPDDKLQASLERIDADLRAKHDLAPPQRAIGLLDLQTQRLAMIDPDRGEYAASVAKIGILLAYFQLHPEAATNLSPVARRELGLMIKSSSNEMAARFSGELGLKQIQAVINQHRLYDTNHGGGLWVGKHYGQGKERFGDPLNNNSHAVTVRQVMRFYLWLEQGRLVSSAASATMREIFASPELPHDPIKFVKALEGRERVILRKWGTWEDWHHDSAVIRGPGRHYILVGLTRHPRGDDYLIGLAQAVDDLLQP
jgi:beta-lactamase class A